MHWIYILYSQKIDKYYIGSSSNVQKRLEFHNSEYN
ncbi:MAG: GIY-YIG nuclease family protein, partial [Bacteroidetes bacterium]